MTNAVYLFSGTSNKNLFDKICEFPFEGFLNKGKGEISSFSDKETFFKIDQSVRGSDCYIIQSTCYPQNHNLMEMFIMADALRRASANSVSAIIPYFGYARQDRKMSDRTPITAKLVADLIVASGISRVVTLDIHSAQSQGFFNIPLFDNLQATSLFAKHILSTYASLFPSDDESTNEVVIVSPDVGGAKRARNFSKKLHNCGLVLIDKRREEANKSEVMNIVGVVKNKTCIITDDMIDTAGTLVNAANACMDEGAKEVIAVATHPIFSGSALEKIQSSALSKVMVTDSIPLDYSQSDNLSKIEVVSVGELIARTIIKLQASESINDMFS